MNEPNVSRSTERTADASQAPFRRVTPAARLSARVPWHVSPPPVCTGLPTELIPMDDDARQNALRALQRSMDRRDNGGSTGHER
ncbi:hypothetical protein RVR_7437 [Actinacidiphila reveromycinica]|uniref:Uncharacterized protein n=1 Tax=Actinacidiphila reveromycinica TaxID=659352 RepID=A0A7U3UX84_9ACTN|nr:hypothetical protein RVR_7437 [Streptomyces sp. SN-593]